jgi:hypothetical protein
MRDPLDSTGYRPRPAFRVWDLLIAVLFAIPVAFPVWALFFALTRHSYGALLALPVAIFIFLSRPSRFSVARLVLAWALLVVVWIGGLLLALWVSDPVMG